MYTFTLSRDEARVYYAARVPGLRGNEYRARAKCPVCQSDNPSCLSIDYAKGVWHCFRCGEGGDAIRLEQALSGAPFHAARGAVLAAVGRPLPDSDESPAVRRKRIAQQQRLRAEAERVATWRDNCLRAIKARQHFALSMEQEACRQWHRASGVRRENLEDIAVHYSKLALDYERRRDAIERASAADLLCCYRAIRGTRPKRVAA